MLNCNQLTPAKGPLLEGSCPNHFRRAVVKYFFFQSLATWLYLTNGTFFFRSIYFYRPSLTLIGNIKSQGNTLLDLTPGTFFTYKDFNIGVVLLLQNDMLNI